MLAIGILVGLVLGAAACALAVVFWSRSSRASALRARDEILREAQRHAETLRREAQVEARERDLRLRGELEEELQERRTEIAKLEERLLAQEGEIERKLTELARREQGIADRELHTRQLQDELKESRANEAVELERIAGMTVGEAKQQLLERSEELVRHELARRVRQLEEEAQAESKRRARNLVADALQRVAASHAAETTV